MKILLIVTILCFLIFNTEEKSVKIIKENPNNYINNSIIITIDSLKFYGYYKD